MYFYALFPFSPSFQQIGLELVLVALSVVVPTKKKKIFSVGIKGKVYGFPHKNKLKISKSVLTNLVVDMDHHPTG